MPGRFTSDTNSRCLLVSRSIWTTTMVDTCYPVATLTGTASVLGIASFSSSGGTFAAAAPRATDGIILNQTVASGIDNVLTFDVVGLEESDEEGVLVTVLETIDNVPYVIGGGRLRQGKDQQINFRATGNNIQVVLNGPYTNLLLAQVCTRYARSTAQTYLVEVCDESKDRYRFGFNGMEKDNELKGVGNSLDFGARIYDSRLGRWLSRDPLEAKFPNSSPYGFVDNSPLIFKDPNGEEKIIVIGGEDNTGADRYKFFNTGLRQALNYANNNPNKESITFVVTDIFVTQQTMNYLKMFANSISNEYKIPIRVVPVNSSKELSYYINNGNKTNLGNSARYLDPISDLSFFGHGYSYLHTSNGDDAFEPGHGTRNEDIESPHLSRPIHDKWEWGFKSVGIVDPQAFTMNSRVDFYSCNAATPNQFGESLVSLLSKRLGNKTIVSGYFGRSDYIYIYEGLSNWEKIGKKGNGGLFLGNMLRLPVEGNKTEGTYNTNENSKKRSKKVSYKNGQGIYGQ